MRPATSSANLQQAWRLPNGNTVINNWVNEWSTKPEDMVGTMQAIEVTPAKQVVWALASWTEPAKLGPATTIPVPRSSPPRRKMCTSGSSNRLDAVG